MNAQQTDAARKQAALGPLDRIRRDGRSFWSRLVARLTGRAVEQ